MPATRGAEAKSFELSTVPPTAQPGSAYATATAAPSSRGGGGSSLLAFPRRALLQCGALSLKNLILLKRNWKSSLLIVLAPALIVVVLGAVAVIESQARNAGQKSPLPFAALDSVAADGGGGGDALRSFPACRIFDRAGGQYGYGAVLPGGACASLAFAPSNNAEAVRIAQALAGIDPALDGTIKTGLTSASPVADVVAHDVVGFTTVQEMERWTSMFSNKGYVSFALAFNSSDAGGGSDALPDDLSYTLRYNETAITNNWYGNANLDPTFAASGGAIAGGVILRAQRAIEEAIVASRVADKGAGGAAGAAARKPAAWLKLQLQQFPKFPFESRFAGGYSINDFAGLFFYVGAMVPFMLTVVAIVDEKERGILGAMRTVGLVESTYWASWLLYYCILTLISTLLLCIAGAAFGKSLPFFYGTSFGLQFGMFFQFTMTMVANAFVYAALLPRFVPAVSVAGGLFFLGLVVQLVMSFTKGLLNGILLDPFLYTSNNLQGGLQAILAYPPISFGFALNIIVTATKPEWLLDPSTNKTVLTYNKFTDQAFRGVPELDTGELHKYLTTNRTSMLCTGNAEQCKYHYSPVQVRAAASVAG